MYVDILLSLDNVVANSWLVVTVQTGFITACCATLDLIFFLVDVRPHSKDIGLLLNFGF